MKSLASHSKPIRHLRDGVERKEVKLEEKLLNKQKQLVLEGIVGSLGIKVKDLSIKFASEKATVSGTVETTEEKEKIVLALGNLDNPNRQLELCFLQDRE